MWAQLCIIFLFIKITSQRPPNHFPINCYLETHAVKLERETENIKYTAMNSVAAAAVPTCRNPRSKRPTPIIQNPKSLTIRVDPSAEAGDSRTNGAQGIYRSHVKLEFVEYRRRRRRILLPLLRTSLSSLD